MGAPLVDPLYRQNRMLWSRSELIWVFVAIGFLLFGLLALYWGVFWAIFGFGILVFVGLISLILMPQFNWSHNQLPVRFATRIGDSLEQGLVVTGLNHRTLYANKFYYDLVEQRRHLPQPLDILSMNALAGEDIVAFQKAIKSSGALMREVRFAPGASTLRGNRNAALWLHIYMQPLAGSPGLLLWQIQNITHSHAREEATYRRLRESEAYFKDTPVGVFSVDSGGQILFLSHSLAGSLGVSPDQAGLTLEHLGFRRPFPDVMLELGDAKADPLVLEHDMPTADGKITPVWILHRKGDQGSRSAVIARHYLASSANPALLREIIGRVFSDLPMGVILIDEAGLIGQANRAFVKLCGVTTESNLLGTRLDVLLRGASRADLKEALESVHDLDDTAEGYPVDVELVRGGDDHVITARLLIKPTGRRESLQGRGYLVYCIDTTEQKSLEARMVQSQKMQALGQLAGGIAHDFNNLLTAIHGFCDLLLARHKPGNPAFREIHAINQTAQRASGLVRQLLTFSRLQRFHSEIMTLTDCVEDLSMTMGRILGENINLDVRHGRDLWSIRGDRTQIEQVVVNLLVNARDAMPQGGIVRIETANVPVTEVAHREEDLALRDYVLCEVIDNGSGIAHDILHKIFDPFFTTKELGHGTGLGLATVYGIMSQNNGAIFVTSHLGEGTSFRLYFPRAAEAGPTAVTEMASNAPDVDMTGSETILLVEDERAVRTIATQALTLRGYHVLEADNGDSARDILDSHEGAIDLLITDVRMPGMSGLDLASEVRRRFPTIKIIFMSGYTEDSLEHWREEVGIDFLAKPFRLEALIRATRTLVERGPENRAADPTHAS